MKNFRSVAVLLLLPFALALAGAELRANAAAAADGRVADLHGYFDSLMADESTRIPGALLARARGVIVLREYKAGFILGVRGGGGIAFVRDPISQEWSPPAFLRTGEGSAGLQIGGQRIDSVILIMNDEGMRVFTQPRFRIGVDARAVAGPRGAAAEARTDPDIPFLVYGASEGLFAGASVEGGFIIPDNRNNAAYHRDAGLTMRDILFANRGERTAAYRSFLGTWRRWEAPR